MDSSVRICQSCNVGVATADIGTHYRSLVHLYNVKRRMNGLGPVSEADFNEKMRLLELSKEEPIKAPQNTKTRSSKTANPEKSQEAIRKANLIRKCRVQQPECVSLFDLHLPFENSKACLEYMMQKYGFFIPDEEYCIDKAGVLAEIWRLQRIAPRCLYCTRRFKDIEAAQVHMRSMGHTQIQWSHVHGESMGRFQKNLYQFFDYLPTYYELLNSLRKKRGKALLNKEDPSDIPLALETSEDALNDEDVIGEEEWEDIEEYSDSEVDDDGHPVAPKRHSNAEAQRDMLLKAIAAEGHQAARIGHSGNLILPSGRTAYGRYTSSHRAKKLPWASIRHRKHHRLGWERKASSLWSIRDKDSNKTTSITLKNNRAILRQVRAKEDLYYRRRSEFDMKVGCKAHKLQRVMLRETKCFL